MAHLELKDLTCIVDEHINNAARCGSDMRHACADAAGVSHITCCSADAVLLERMQVLNSACTIKGTLFALQTRQVSICVRHCRTHLRAVANTLNSFLPLMSTLRCNA